MKITDKRKLYKVQLLKHKQIIRHLEENYNYSDIYPIINTINEIQKKEKPEGYTIFSHKNILPRFTTEKIKDMAINTKLTNLNDKLVIVNKNQTHIISQKPRVQEWIIPFLKRYKIYENYSIIPHFNQYKEIDGVTLYAI